MRLIDADALKPTDEDYMPTWKWLPWTEVLKAPTIDPVKHGKWNWFPTQMKSDTEVSGIGECSICRHLSIECGRFCNWCGARMDGE